MTSAFRQFIRSVLQERIRSTGISSVGEKSSKFKFEEFKKLKTLSQAFNYARDRLEYIAHGSSRITFVMTGNKVLKVALNNAGIAQNEQEIEVFTNPETQFLVTKIYQYDPQYHWLVSETVKPFSEDHQIEVFLDLGTIHDWDVKFDRFIESAVMGEYEFLEHVKRQRHQNNDDLVELAEAINKFVETTNMGGGWGDLMKADSWGRSPENRFVLLDFGFTDAIADEFYSPEGVK